MCFLLPVGAILVLRVDGLVVPGDSGVIAEDVHIPVGAEGKVDQFLHILFIRDIGFFHNRGSARVDDELCDLFERFLIEVGQCQFRSLTGKEQGGCLSDTTGGAGDNSDLSVQTSKTFHSYLL